MQCPKGFFSELKNVCQPCLDHCADCLSNSSCEVCEKGFEINESRNICSTECKNENQFYNVQTMKCENICEANQYINTETYICTSLL